MRQYRAEELKIPSLEVRTGLISIVFIFSKPDLLLEFRENNLQM